jgi:hypothetical protein
VSRKPPAGSRITSILESVRKASVIAVAILAFAVSSSLLSASSASARSCGTVAAPGFHAFETHTKRISCRSARRILKSWFANGAKPSSGPRGWHCRSSFARPWRCTRRDAVITFIFHSY